MMLIEVLGLYMADTGTAGTGWFFALVDKQLGAAMGAMHSDPGYRWTVQQLAERAALQAEGRNVGHRLPDALADAPRCGDGNQLARVRFGDRPVPWL
jgi:hypothetical protein